MLISNSCKETIGVIKAIFNSISPQITLRIKRELNLKHQNGLKFT